jgi:DNA-binding CsgD family transcriptional regulator
MSLDRIESLTQREIEILRLLDVRLSNEEIATVLHLSPEAVQRQTYRIYRKLRIRTRAYSDA